MGEAALVTLGTIVLIIKFPADILGGFWFDDLPLDGVREKTVEAILAVAHVEVDAGVEASFNMKFATLLSELSVGTGAFADSKVLISTEPFNLFKFSLESLVLQELFVVHLLNYIVYENSYFRSLIFGASHHPLVLY